MARFRPHTPEGDIARDQACLCLKSGFGPTATNEVYRIPEFMADSTPPYAPPLDLQVLDVIIKPVARFDVAALRLVSRLGNRFEPVFLIVELAQIAPVEVAVA